MSAQKPTKAGRYLDTFGNTWRLWNDGLFAMLGNSDADPDRYGPWKRLVVEEEPEWEYRSHVVNEIDRHILSDWTDQETALAILGWEGGTVRAASWLERRRPAGQPERVPVKQEGAGE